MKVYEKTVYERFQSEPEARKTYIAKDRFDHF